MRYRVNIGLRYPVGPGLDAVRRAGGLKGLTDDQRAALTFAEPAVGTVVDDVPVESAAWLVEQGVLTPLADEEATDGE